MRAYLLRLCILVVVVEGGTGECSDGRTFLPWMRVVVVAETPDILRLSDSAYGKSPQDIEVGISKVGS